MSAFFIPSSHRIPHFESEQLNVVLLLVAKQFQNQGIGSLMMQDIVEYVKLNGIKQLTLSLPKAEKGFKRLGFKEVDFIDQSETDTNLCLSYKYLA